MKDYITVENEAQIETEVKKSRFIASVRHIENEAEAFAFINEVKSQYKEASHNVYAFVCRDNNSERYTDDGEPAKTAGMPVLDVLLKGNITDACIVVTRYFGGTLLGTGGLVRAYGQAAKDAVQKAGVVKMVYSKIYSLATDYSYIGKIQYAAAEKGYEIIETQFGQNVYMTLGVEDAGASRMVDDITQITNGQAKIEFVGERFVKTKPGQ
ncbi:MAG: YigZ family protein [Clostridia bacterium]|nr:YigZ family protein [Clostridia bacterium]